MKTITLNSALVAILCLASANGWAQDYPTMLEGNPKWICLASDVDGEPTFKTFYLDGDTTINGKTYQKLYYEWMYKNGKSVLGHPVNIAALREYDGKVLAAKALVQKETPSFTTIQSATVPLGPSGPKKELIMLVCLFLAVFGTTIYALYKEDQLKPLLGLS
jgi:hypothetical protein